MLSLAFTMLARARTHTHTHTHTLTGMVRGGTGAEIGGVRNEMWGSVNGDDDSWGGLPSQASF